MNPSSTPELEVLIVDDDPFIRETIQLFLESEGFQVRCASDGEKGIELLQVREPDVALVDLRMPRLDGIDVLREFKKISPEVEVVMATGAATLESALAAMKLGAYSYIEKPIVDLEKDLLEVLLRAAERRKLRQTNRDLQKRLQLTQHRLEAEQRKNRSDRSAFSLETTLRRMATAKEKQIEDLVLSTFPRRCSPVLYIRQDQHLIPCKTRHRSARPAAWSIDRFTDPGERWREGDFPELIAYQNGAVAFPLFWLGRLEGLIVIEANHDRGPAVPSLAALRCAADALAALLGSIGTRSSSSTG